MLSCLCSVIKNELHKGTWEGQAVVDWGRGHGAKGLRFRVVTAGQQVQYIAYPAVSCISLGVRRKQTFSNAWVGALTTLGPHQHYLMCELGLWHMIVPKAVSQANRNFTILLVCP
jgi:hypothetical protein